MQFEASVSLQKRVVNTTKVMTLQQTVYIRPLSRNYIKVREILPRLQKHVYICNPKTILSYSLEPIYNRPQQPKNTNNYWTSSSEQG